MAGTAFITSRAGLTAPQQPELRLHVSSEVLALAYRQERGLDFVTSRLFNTVGRRQSGQYGMVVARFVRAAVAGTPLEIHGDGTQTRTFCHVQDTIRALKGLMDAPAVSGDIF